MYSRILTRCNFIRFRAKLGTHAQAVIVSAASVYNDRADTLFCDGARDVISQNTAGGGRAGDQYSASSGIDHVDLQQASRLPCREAAGSHRASACH